MSIKKFATSAAVIASMLAASLTPIAATSASAKDWRKHGGGHSYSHNHAGPRYHGHSHNYRSHRHYKRHRHGHDVAKGLAIGLGVLAVGSILASEAHR